MKTRIFKALSILLAVMIVFSACACILGTVSADETVYEVSSDGTYKTIDEAIIAANGAGKGAGDTVTVKVKDGDTVTVSETSDFSTAHEFKLVITSDNGATITSAIAGRNIILGGPTEFYNVAISSGNKSFRFKDQDVKLGKGTTLAVNGYVTVSSNTDTLTDDVDIDINVKTGKEVMFSNDGYNNTKTFDKNINVVYDYNDPNTTQTFAFGSIYGSSATTFNKNVNFNIKSGNVKLNNGYPHTFGEGSAVQIINSSGNGVVNFDTVTATNKWLLTNTSTYNDVLSFTDTAGKYAVDTERYIVTATKKGATAGISAADGELNLTESGAGEYDVAIEKVVYTKQYFVSDDGDDTDDGLTPDTAFKTIDAAIIAANAAGLDSADDIVTVKVIDGETVIVSETSDFSTAHKFRLVITSDSGATVTSATTGRNIILGGPTEFNNVAVSSGNKSFRFHDNDVKFGAGTTLSVGGYVTVSSKPDALVDDVDIEVNVKTGKEIMFSNDGYGNTKTFNKNINVVYDYNDPNTTQTFAFGSIFGTSSTTFNNNININVKSGSVKLNNSYPHTFGEGSAVQIINSSGNAITNFDTVTAPNKWLLTNSSKYSDAISFTDTVGQYAVDTVNYVVTATKKGDTSGTVYTPADGILDLTAGGAGEYTVKVAVAEPTIFNYYVGKGVAPDNATVYKTIADVIAAANSNPEISVIDIVVANILGTETVQYSNDPSALLSSDYEHGYTLKITAEFPTTMVNIAADVADQGLMGDTIFDNVTTTTLKPSDMARRSFFFNGHNVTFNENVTIYPKNEVIFTGTRLSATFDEEQTVIFNNLRTSDSYLEFACEYGTATYNESLTVIYNHPDSDPRIAFTHSSGHKNDFKKDVNVVLNSVSLTCFENPLNSGIGGALRVVTEKELTDEIKDSFATVTAAQGSYTILNKTGITGSIKFTDTAGKIMVDIPSILDIIVDGPDGDVEVGKDRCFTLGKEGEYTVTAQEVAPESRKMLYFKLAGSSHYLSTRALNMSPGVDYVFEYSIVTNLLADSKPSVHDGDYDYSANLAGGTGVTSYTTTQVGDYYRVVAQVTIPEAYTKNKAFFGIEMAPFSEGYIFDRTVYRADDETKTDLLEGGNYDFSQGLDYIKLDANSQGGLWAAVWPEDPAGMVVWERGAQKLEVMPYNADTIKAFLKSLNPEDGEWWKEEDVIEEEEVITYASAKGTFKDSTGKGINNTKMLLISEEKEYTATTNANGEFDFGKILTGFYELYVLNGSEKIFTGFSQYIAPDDVVTFNVTSDISNLAPDYEVTEDAEEEEEVEEIVPSGNLSGTVYTPYLETVADLKLYLEGVGEITTDENGNFAFADVPVGKYKLYTVLEDESEYVFRDVEINENVDLKVKLKYDPPKESITEEVNNGWIIWVIVASVVALVVVAGLIFFLVFKKKKA